MSVRCMVLRSLLLSAQHLNHQTKRVSTLRHLSSKYLERAFDQFQFQTRLSRSSSSRSRSGRSENPVNCRNMSSRTSKDTQKDSEKTSSSRTESEDNSDSEKGVSAGKDDRARSIPLQKHPAKESSSKDETTPPKYATRKKFTEEHTRTVKEAKDKYLNMPIIEKRKLYKCKNKYMTLDKIETWPELFVEQLKENQAMTQWWSKNETDVEFGVREDLNDKISLFSGDITALEIDAIANAANETLLGGGGVDGAIHSAAGRQLLLECELLKGCHPGDAKISGGYKLPAKHVIHTVGPRGERPTTLESCYRETLNRLKENQLKSVAFPCISTGIFGYPNKNAGIVALRTVRKWLESEDYAQNVERIIFCLFLDKDKEIYNKYGQLIFPVKRDASLEQVTRV